MEERAGLRIDGGLLAVLQARRHFVLAGAIGIDLRPVVVGGARWDVGGRRGNDADRAAAVDTHVVRGVGLEGPRINVLVAGGFRVAFPNYNDARLAVDQVTAPGIEIGQGEEVRVHIVHQRRETGGLAGFDGAGGGGGRRILKDRLCRGGSYHRHIQGLRDGMARVGGQERCHQFAR